MRRRPAKAARITINTYEALTTSMFQFGLNPPTLVEKFRVDSSITKIIGTAIAESHRDQRFILNTPNADVRAKHACT